MLATISLKSISNFQKRAIDLGVLKEDEECRLNTIIWDLVRLDSLFSQQMGSILERIDEKIDIDETIKSLLKASRKRKKAE